MALTAAVLKTESDVVKTEGPNRYSRDEVTILSGPRVFHQAVKTAMMQYKCISSGGDISSPPILA